MKAAVAPDLSDYTFTPDLTLAGTLLTRWYTDPSFLPLENELIFSKTWQPVGRVEMVLRPGDFFTCELAGEPLVITRDKAGVLRGFYNVCRHGGRLGKYAKLNCF